MRISDWSSDVCSSDLADARAQASGTADVERIGAHDIDAARARVDGVGEEAHRLVTREAVCDQDVPDPRARQQAGEGDAVVAIDLIGIARERETRRDRKSVV